MNNNRTAHFDLLEQVADTADELETVRRILSAPPAAPLTEADLDAQQAWLRAPWPATASNHAHRYSACRSGPCDQGRKLCPSPEACQCAEPAAPGSESRAGRAVRAGAGAALLVVAVLMAAGIAAAAAALAGALQ